MSPPSIAILVSLFLVGAADAQTPASDSLLVARGIVELRTDLPDSAHRWVVFLPAPVLLQSLRTNTIALADGEHLAGRFMDRYVELRGMVGVERDAVGHTFAIAHDARLREVRPEGLVQRDVDLSVTEHATVQLAVVPRTTIWGDSTGSTSGITPMVLFSIINRSQTDLRFFFSTNEVVCVLVRPVDAVGAHEITWKVSGPAPMTLRMGSVFRQVMAIPKAVAAYPGRYVVRAALCGEDEYHLETPFEIHAQ